MNLISPTQLRLESDVSGSACELIYEEETVEVDALEVSSVGDLLHANAKVLAVDYRVLTSIAGSDGDGFEIGIEGATDAFASGIALTAAEDSTSAVIADAESASAEDQPILITITLEGDTPTEPPTSGSVHVGIWQVVFTGPTV